MPPMRNLPMAKPVKTERTHEENQERAYIAASRRSDRSLEARVESARRASEIHKKRTGRSLRVTEQDVVNEEMYEEEDDDLPMQYRRLTAHLQTTNADFDRRLAAYLTNHVAMRTALGAAVSDNYVHPQYTNAPQFANQMAQFPQQQQQFASAMLPPSMANRSPQNFRQTPYPMSAQQGYRPNAHNRSSTLGTPQEVAGYQHSSASPQSPAQSFKQEDRRMSLPVHAMPPTPQSLSQMTPQQRTSPVMSRNSSSTSLANLKHEAKRQSSPSHQQERPQIQPLQIDSQQSNLSYAQSPGFQQNPFAGMSFGGPSMPFTTALSTESAQLLGPSLDPNDPWTAMLLGNQEYKPQQSFYSYNPNGASGKPKGLGLSPPSNFDGMNQTLAPGMLDTTYHDSGNYSTPMSAADSAMTPQSAFGGYGFENSYSDMFKASSTSGLTTPGEHDWANLIDANVWEEASSQPAVS